VCIKASRWIVHKWDMINFPANSWLPNLQPLNSILRGPWQLTDLNIKVNTVHCNGIWDLNSISYPIPHDISTIIQRTFILLNTRANDNIIWNLTPTGMFSSRSAYNFIASNFTSNPGQEDLYDWIWKLKVPNKIKFFTWLMHTSHWKLPPSHWAGY